MASTPTKITPTCIYLFQLVGDCLSMPRIVLNSKTFKICEMHPAKYKAQASVRESSRMHKKGNKSNSSQSASYLAKKLDFLAADSQEAKESEQLRRRASSFLLMNPPSRPLSTPRDLVQTAPFGPSPPSSPPDCLPWPQPKAARSCSTSSRNDPRSLFSAVLREFLVSDSGLLVFAYVNEFLNINVFVIKLLLNSTLYDCT